MALFGFSWRPYWMTDCQHALNRSMYNTEGYPAVCRLKELKIDFTHYYVLNLFIHLFLWGGIQAIINAGPFKHIFPLSHYFIFIPTAMYFILIFIYLNSHNHTFYAHSYFIYFHWHFALMLMQLMYKFNITDNIYARRQCTVCMFGENVCM